MPIYEYVCNSCGHEFEEWQKILDAPVHRCPSCGKRKVERLVSLSTFHLKGTGWYVTDYAGKKSGSTPGEKSGSTPGEKKDDKKAEKTESKTEKSEKSESKKSEKD